MAYIQTSHSTLVLTIILDVILPLIIFIILQGKLKSVYILLIAGIPPLIMILIKILLKRTLDPLGCLVFLIFIISAIVAIVTKSDMALLLEKSLVTAIASLIFVMTLIPWCCCKHRCTLRPLVYYLYEELLPTKREHVGLPDAIFDNKQNEAEILGKKLSDKEEISQVYEWIYIHCSSFRFSCYLITSIWSIGFLFEFIGKLTLILVHLSVNEIVIYGRVILSIITGICIILTIVLVTKERKQTLAFIQQWKQEHLNEQHQQQQLSRRSNVSVWTVTKEFNENNFRCKINNKRFDSV